jgi:phosphoribosylformylglycinamidine synthase
MPSRGGSGIESDLSRVPRREAGMTPYEVMLSESQERMLLVVKRGSEARIQAVFARWGLNAVVIGRVTDDGRMRVRDGESVVADIPVRALTEEAPVYRRPVRRPARLGAMQRLSLGGLREPEDYAQTLLTLLGSPTIADKSRVYEQYDHMVQTNTVVLPGRADAAVLRIKPMERGAARARGRAAAADQAGSGPLLAATIDGNGRYCALDPYVGGQLAVAEAARNLACVGAKPLAVTDCMNFGNPQDPQILWQFKECVRGISEACRAFGTPVTGGNVSFYNEGPRGAIDPTPVIGMIGLIEVQGSRFEVRGSAPGPEPITASFKCEGDVILLLGETREELGGSEYLAVIHRRKAGKPPRVDLKRERALQRLLAAAAGQQLIVSAHDCSDGGLAVTLAECCMMGEAARLGATVSLPAAIRPPRMRADALLFGESAGRAIVSCRPGRTELMERLAQEHEVPMAAIGRTGGPRLFIEPWVDVPVDELNAAWRTGLARSLEAR